jgi:hypothetical protein
VPLVLPVSVMVQVTFTGRLRQRLRGQLNFEGPGSHGQSRWQEPGGYNPSGLLVRTAPADSHLQCGARSI